VKGQSERKEERKEEEEEEEKHVACSRLSLFSPQQTEGSKLTSVAGCTKSSLATSKPANGTSQVDVFQVVDIKSKHKILPLQEIPPHPHNEGMNPPCSK